MADISLIQDVCMDDCDEGVYEQGDCSSGSSADDEVLPPLSRVQKYAQSGNVFDRQMVARIVQELFRTAPADILAEEIPNIMAIIKNLGEKDEAMVRADLLEQIPHMASQAIKYSDRVEPLGTVVGDYLLPLVVRNLGCSDNGVDKAAHSTLIHLLEQELITKPQAEIQVCPAILALSNANEEQTADVNSGAITLMSKMAPLLGRDVTERIFLTRFSELCGSQMFYMRKVCASHIGEFCAVVGQEKFERVLLPCYMALCQDTIWGVRKSCAEVIMFVSAVCPPELRRSSLASVFANLLQDGCRWVQMAAFQTLGPFIATFADPPIANTAYNEHGDLVFVNTEGSEFLINSSSMPDVRFCKYLPKQPSMNSLEISNSNDDWWDYDENQSPIAKSFVDYFGPLKQGDEDIKEIVETVKNAVLSYKSTEEEPDVIGDLKSNVIKDIEIENATCDNLGSKLISELSVHFNNTAPEEVPSTSNCSEPLANSGDQVSNPSGNDAATAPTTTETQVNLSDSENCKEDDNLHLFNSYNYWYISPEMPLDLSIINVSDDQPAVVDKVDDCVFESNLQDLYANINLNDTTYDSVKNQSYEINKSENGTSDVLEQDIVPQVLINNFILMTDSSFAINIDTEMSYHCAYSLPAVAMTLEDKSWPLLKHTIERLAGDMQYKVRRTVASSLHELALILGRDVATEHLTPIFEGFIKDLDEVRIGILKHLAYFLRIIKPERRVMYLPRLHEFMNTENEWNWRFRHELVKQLLLLVTLFKPIESAKHIGLIAETLLHDVSAVRQEAISLITELLRHISTKPGLNSLYLVRLVEKFAHSKKWKRRQTFALLCNNLLSCSALPADQFASEIMPHLLDLSWDPVANVRLVVAKTIAQHIIPNEYFADPNNQHFDSLGTVIRRLQTDSDRDVRQYAEISEASDSSEPSPAALEYSFD